MARIATRLTFHCRARRFCRGRPGLVRHRPLAAADAAVTVNGNPAYALATDDLAYFFGSDDFDNSAGGGFAELEVSATMSDGTNDLVSVVTNRVFVPSANETYAYDADGNQTLVTTGTGEWHVEYNGANRPVRWTCGDKVLLMDYDHMGRRRSCVEQKGNVVKKRHVFTYDGYLQIARSRVVDADFGEGDDAFLWDPTESVATRPLASSLSTSQALSSSTFFYALDGNKNVTELIDADGEIAAHYEYSAFGKTLLSLSADDRTDSLNPWRFSSEYADDATQLVYYNYRHYEPVIGRWQSLDPLGDDTVAPYMFCKNSPVVDFDQLGLQSIIGYVDPNVSRTWQRFVESLYDDGFFAALPNCPCCIDVSGSSPTLEPKDASDAGWGRVNEANPEHPGATWEVRWVDPTGTLTQGQQCTYDNKGRLITKPPAAGTPDKVSYDDDKHSLWDLHYWGHALKDWIPYKILPKNTYFKHWPPNNGNGCPENSGQ